MAGEIFISYRRADQAWARLLHDHLKREGVEAWYDAQVGAGQDWRVATAKALEESQIFVLLFSENAAQSSDIAKELAAATLEKKLIIPVRLQDIAPKGAFLYELASRNWVNAYEDTEAKLAELAKGLAHLVKTGARDEGVLPFDRAEGSGHGRAPKKSMRIPAVIAATAIVIVAAAIALWLHGASKISGAEEAVKTLPAPATAVANLPASPRPAGNSIAVLPFANLSSDKDQEFFSDGMTEELTSALAKVPGLTVIGRTSAFQFKGENKDLRAIGQALGAKNLIEGSVRKAGNEVRITAELINAADGTQLWTQSYDRKLTDIFAVQEDIATAIAGALKVPLGLKEGENLVSNRTSNSQSYQDYLHGLALGRARKIDELITLAKAMVARDPGYAPGWALLAGAYTAPTVFAPFQAAVKAGATDEARRLLQAQYAEIEQAARQALKLDPRNVEALSSLGSVEDGRGNWAVGQDYYHKALAIDPNDTGVLYSYSYSLGATGKVKQAMQITAQIIAQEPFVPIYQSRMADLLWASGRNDEAIRAFLAMANVDHVRLAKAYATAGRFGEAADLLKIASPTSLVTRAELDEAAQLLRTAPAKTPDPAALPSLPAELSFVYLFIGADSRSLEFVERMIALGFHGGFYRDPWAPPSAVLRKTEYFKEFARKAGFVDYWRARGWPDHCHPVGADDFACE